MLRLHLPMGRLFPLPLDVGILPCIVLRMVASSLSFTFRCFTRTLLSYDHGASSNIARGCGRFLLPTFVASLSIPCLTDDGHPLYVSGGSASFRPHTFRCPALSICASRPQKPPYSKRKWSIPVGNFRSAVVHAILTGLAFLLYWQRMWRIRWLPLDGSVPCFTAMASSVCREGCSRFRYFKCIISLFLRVRASLYDCSIYRNGETM